MNFSCEAPAEDINARSRLWSQAVKMAGIGVAAALVMVGNVSAQEIKGNAAAAADKVSMCQGCHSIPFYKSSYPEVYSVPKIGGQSEQYLINALTAYREGTRSHPTMRAMAGSLNDQEIADLAAYFAQTN